MSFKFDYILNNCQSSLSEGDYNSESEYILTVTSIEGYNFIGNVPKIMTYSNMGDYREINLNYVNDSQYTITLVNLQSISHVTLQAIATKNSAIKNKYGLINVYKPTLHELQMIAQNRFYKFEGNLEYIDTAKFLVSLIKIYCNVESSDKEEVYFGQYKMGVKCDTVSTDIITLNCGSVTITEKYHNSLDYQNTTINLYLPFIGFINLEVTDYMNKEVYLKYQVNIINGESLAILSVNDTVIFTQSCDISFKIPFTMEDKNFVESAITPNTNYLNNSAPYIIIKRPKIISIPAYNDFNEYDSLSDYTGYVEVSELNFNVIHNYITKTEIEEIKTLLNQGVIF